MVWEKGHLQDESAEWNVLECETTSYLHFALCLTKAAPNLASERM